MVRYSDHDLREEMVYLWDCALLEMEMGHCDVEECL